ncbi:MAG: toll/interleukin-1 receptor domain-containing protein [Candidatus Thorarchaeota archaeon]
MGFVKFFIFEELDENGILKTFQLSSANHDFVIALPDEYEIDINEPFHFLDDNDKELYHKSRKSSKDRPLGESRFKKLENSYLFKTEWREIPWHFTFYTLTLPKNAYIENLFIYDENLKNTVTHIADGVWGQRYNYTVFKDLKRKRLAIYLRDLRKFILTCEFRIDKDGFNTFSDNHIKEEDIRYVFKQETRGRLISTEEMAKIERSLNLEEIHDVFISYSSKDKEIADVICHYLEEAKIRCWIAPRDTLGSYASSITKAIENSKLMVLIFSNNANLSGQVKNEVNLAVSNGITIQPFRIENVTPDDDFKFYMQRWHWLDALTPPLEDHIMKLVAMVSKLLRVIGNNESKKKKA